MKRTLEELQRRVEADPADMESRIAWMTAKARHEGSNVYLEPLTNLRTWMATPLPIQDLTITEIQRRFPKLQLLATGSWCCPSLTSASYRLASFQDSHTGLVMNLLPGTDGIEAFLMGRWFVTEEQFSRGQRGAVTTHRGSSQPKTRLRFTRARDWCRVAGFRLPSAGEWMHACRAGTETTFFWGEDFDARYVWYSENSTGSVQPLEDHESQERWNAFGLVDMLGNLWEWCLGLELLGGSFLSPGPFTGIPRLQGQGTSSGLYGFRVVKALS